MPDLDLEMLPNRDSVSYEDPYGLQDATTLLRGTLRYRGFSRHLALLARLGLLSEDPEASLAPGAPPQTWPALVWALLRRQGMVEGETAAAEATVLGMCRLMGYPDDDPQGTTEEVAALRTFAGWLGLLGSGVVPPRPDGWGAAALVVAPGSGTLLDATAALLASHPDLQYHPGERDMVLMRHEFVVAYPGGRRERRTSTLRLHGVPGGHSAMATTVGLPVALTVELLLQDPGAVGSGVVTPLHASLYQPVLEGLARHGVALDERVEGL